MTTMRSILLPASLVVAGLMILSIVVSLLQPLWQGKPFDPATSFRAGARLAINSSSGKAAIRAVARGVGQPVEVTGTASSATDSWIAIYLPFDKALITEPGRSLDAKVTLEVLASSAAIACIGIFDGKQDHCSPAQPLTASRSIEVRSRIIDAAKAQIKINIFPKSPDEKILFRVQAISMSVTP